MIVQIVYAICIPVAAIVIWCVCWLEKDKRATDREAREREKLLRRTPPHGTP